MFEGLFSDEQLDKVLKAVHNEIDPVPLEDHRRYIKHLFTTAEPNSYEEMMMSAILENYNKALKDAGIQ
jgi:hypothetical protein